MSMFSRRTRTAAAVGLTAIALIAAAPAADAAHATPGTGASAFLARELVRTGHHLTTTYAGTAYPDYGLTADAILALDAAKTSQREAVRSTSYLESHITDYIGAGTEKYAGASAKALVVALAQRRVNPGHLGGVNLTARVIHLMNGHGRFADQSTYGDSSNTFSQSFSIIGIKKAGRGVDAKAISFLLRQQCPGGGFRLYEANPKCTDRTTADPDATSMAIQALNAIHPTTASRRAVTAAQAFLVKDRAGNGGFHGGPTTPAVNTNSTSLAIIALANSGRPRLISSARAYLLRMQYGCAFPSAFVGAVAYKAAAKSAAAAAGPSARPVDQDRRSTTQAVLGLTGTPLIDISNAGAKKTAVAIKCG